MEFLPHPGIGIIGPEAFLGLKPLLFKSSSSRGIYHSPSLKMSEHEYSGESVSLIGRLSSLTDTRESEGL